MPNRYDTIILGAGPAGLTAGIYLARAKRRPLIVDTGTAGGQTVLSYHVANYPGVEATSGSAISQTMLRQAESFGAEVITQAEVLEVDLLSEEKRIVIEDEGTFVAPTVILAIGGVPRMLGLDSEKRFKGKGISYCATCDGDFFTDKPIAVVGGGNSALEEASSLTKYASKVTIIHEFDHFQAQSWIVDEALANPKIELLMNQRIDEFEGDEKLVAVRSTDKTTGKVARTEVDGCFVFIGYVPNTAELDEELALSERGEVLADENMATNIPGVYVAGDVRQKRYRQITTAVADGTIAALAASDTIETLNRSAAAPA